MTEDKENFSFGEMEISFIAEAINTKEMIVHNINDTLLSKYEFLLDVVTREIKKLESTELIIEWSDVTVMSDSVFFLGTLTQATGSFVNMDFTAKIEQLVSGLGRKIYFAIPFLELAEFKTEEDYINYAIALINKNAKPIPKTFDTEFDLSGLTEEQIMSLRTNIEYINTQPNKPKLC